jgi:hypothetical protein
MTIIAIAFNNTQALNHQIRIINKCLSDDFVFIIVDNYSITTQNIKYEIYALA